MATGHDDEADGGDAGAGDDRASAPPDPTLVPELDPADLPPADPTARPVVEGYELLERIGRGGSATVWRARQRSIDRIVALKVLDERLLDDGSLRRFENEARSLAELSWNPGIAHVYDSGTTEDGRPFLAMEFLDGGSLGERLRTEGPLAPEEVARTGLVLADALRAAHESGITHRDVKPDNVLLDRRGDPRLADFGISRVLGQTTDTGSGSFRGTVLYSAPEVLDGGSAGRSTDIWGVGATLYALAAGHAPFARTGDDEDTITAILRRTLLEDPPPLPDTVPAGLSTAIMSCLAKDPADRPASMTELHDLLTGEAPVASAARAGGGARGDSGTGDGGRRARVALVGAAVVAALVVGGFLVASAGEDSAAPSTTSEPSGEDDVDGQVEDADPGEDPSEVPPPITRSGASNVRAVTDPDVTDSTGFLQDKIAEFVRTTTATPVTEGALLNAVDGQGLGVGTPPTLFDYGAGNAEPNPACQAIQLDDVLVTGLAGGIWLHESGVTTVVATRLADPITAERYYWATALFQGLKTGQCDGWPEDGVAVDPDDLTVDRQDVPLDADGAQVLTKIDPSPNLEGIRMGISYELLALVGDTLIVATSASKDAAAPEDHRAVLQQALDTFTS